jgi:carboxypeptidase PM20D1
MKKTLLFVLAVLVILVVVLVVRTGRLASRQIEVEPVAEIEVDEEAVAEHLAGALRFRTISHQDSTQFDGGPFLDFLAYLAETYTGVHRVCGREVVADYSLLFRCPGGDPSLGSILLMAHIDVVPVQPGTESDWTHPAYGGEIADGYVWGRGALDDKAALITILEAAEMLIEQGVRPQRTVYLAFGHDEEIGGLAGASAIAELLGSGDVELELVLDEGGVVTDGVPGIGRSVAVVGIAEKGFISVELVVRTEGGHSSMPPSQTAVGILSAAIRELETHPVPGGIRGATEAMFEYLAPEMPFSRRLFIANRWLFGPLIERQFGASPEGNAMLRTTTAATIFQAGVKDNVLPASARAVVNFRILPGDSTESVVEHVRRTVDDPRVEVNPLRGRNPSPVSDLESEAFTRLQRTIGQVFPHTIVAPYLVVGGTDSRYYVDLSSNVYRFGPLEVGRGDYTRVHGTDERIPVAGLADMVRFYVQLIRNSDA